jgi:OPT family oligopeptide transporter
MLQYHDIPWIWWTALFGICFIVLMVTTSVFPTQTPAWAVIITLVLSAVIALPVAMLQAITNQHVPTQVFHEFVAGYILPNRPVANMVLKSLGYVATSQAAVMAGNFKLGHYMKVPPRVLFAVQLVAAFIGSLVSCGVQMWAMDNIEDFCDRQQKDGFICPSSRAFATASLIWGGIGPKRLFSPGAP